MDDGSTPAKKSDNYLLQPTGIIAARLGIQPTCLLQILENPELNPDIKAIEIGRNWAKRTVWPVDRVLNLVCNLPQTVRVAPRLPGVTRTGEPTDGKRGRPRREVVADAEATA